MTQPVPTRPPERLPRIPLEAMTEEQRAVAAQITAGPRGEVRGPFVPLLRSPGVCGPLQALGEYLRYRCPLDRRIAEMATLIAARHMSQQYEWQAHEPHALKAGLAPEVIEAIAQGRRPPVMARDEAALHDLLSEVLRTGGASDPTYAQAVEVFGEQGVVELVVIAGYYSALAMVLNVARTALPAGREPRLPPFPF